MVQFWEEYTEEESGKLMSRLLAQVELIDFYLSKVEFYLGKKQQSAETRDHDENADSGEEPSRSSSFQGSSKVDIETGPSSARSTGSSSAKPKQIGHFDLQDEYIKFKDFSEPNILKTGYIIPLKCGHNGSLSRTERTLYEIHLTNAGFIVPQQVVQIPSFEEDDLNEINACAD